MSSKTQQFGSPARFTDYSYANMKARLLFRRTGSVVCERLSHGIRDALAEQRLELRA